VQRSVQTQWNDWFVADDVVMIALDPQVTRIDLADTSQPFQVAQGSVVEDSDGRRQVSLLFPAGTTATITRADGSTAQLDTLDVRATEYTVGASGPDAMPAPLPATSAYTYAVELSVDQAIAQGIKVDGKDVVFNQPVPFYLDNFLDFPVGAAVPVGYYNADIAAWVPYPNGRIVKILGEDNGHAVLDVSGSGQPASADELTAFGITDAELAQLAATYAPGISLWRVPLTHFSTWDHNWPYGPPPDAEPPKVDPPKKDDPPDSDEENKCKGCIVSPQVRSLGESIPIAGTPYSLHYQSERAPGFGRNSVTIPLTGSSVPASLQTVELTITIAGQRETQRFAAAPNLSHTFVWDGLDGMGRPVVGSATAFIKLNYIYPCEYRPGDNGFAQFGDSANPIGTRDRCQGFEIPAAFTLPLRSPVTRGRFGGAANWGISIEHRFDESSGVLQSGFGSKRTISTPTISTIAGSPQGERGFSGDGGAAILALFDSPRDVWFAADGTLFVADTSNGRVRRISPDGRIDTVAGSGGFGTQPDEEGAIATRRNVSPTGVAVGPDGSIYIAEAGFNRVRRVSPQGIIRTVAGGAYGYFGDGGPAIAAGLVQPTSIALGPDGSLYITDTGNHAVRRVAPDGIISTVAGTGVAGFSGDGGIATNARLSRPTDIAIVADGSMYIVDSINDRARRVAADGRIETFAGNGALGFSGDGGLAVEASLFRPEWLAIGAEGDVYINEFGGRVRRINTGGLIDTVAGTGAFDFTGDGGPATLATFNQPRGIAIGPDGGLYIADTFNNVVRRVARGDIKSGTNGDLAIPSEDGASRFVFDSAGRHLRTENALTGQMVLTFARDAEGRLLTVTDADGNVTTIERDGNGQPTAIIAPHGQRTALTVDGNQHLTGVVDPTGATWAMQYTDSGLMTQITHPKGGVNAFTYDADGRLLRDLDPEGGGWQLNHTEQADGSDRTEMISGEGRVRVFSTTRQSNGSRLYTDQSPDGTITTRSYDDAGATTITQADGTVLFTKEGPDPRFKMDAPILAERKVTLPSGLAFQQTTTRAVTLADPADALSLQSLTDTVSTNGRVETAAFDAAARRWTFASPANRVVTLSVDDQSRPLMRAVAGLEPATVSYDSRGRLSVLAQGSGSAARATRLDYYAATDSAQAGFLRSITDTIGRETTFTYDAAGRMTARTLPDGDRIGFQYDAQGNLAALTPPGRSAHVFNYDRLDQTTAYTPPDLSGIDTITRYHYNLDRQTTRIERPGGAVIDFVYDSGGRVASRTIPTGVDTYAYDATTGQLATIDTSDGIGLAFTWDGLLPKTTVWSGPVRGSISRTFDSNFWITRETVEGDAVDFTYDADGLLVQAGGLSLAHDPGNGLVTSVGVGIVDETRDYNGFGELESRSVSATGAPVYQVTYARDPLGRIVEQAETTGATTATLAYAYDVDGRLSEVRRNGALAESYTFDVNSNRATKTTLAGTITYSYDAQDRLLEASGTNGATSYAYTEAGDLRAKTTAAGTTAYDYDAVGNLRAVVLPNGKNITYLIDGQDRRVGKRVDGVLMQGWLYGDQLNPVAELDGQGNVVARFVYADQLNVPVYMTKGGATYRIVSDYLGSPRLVIDTATGAVAQRMDYDAFGNVVTDTNPGFQSFGFAGGLYDPDTGLVRFGARDYDPETGRWTAKDPIGFAGGESGLYSYVGVNPIGHVDPSGLGPVAFGVCTVANIGFQAYSLHQATQIKGRDQVQSQLKAINKKISECPADDLDQFEKLIGERDRLIMEGLNTAKSHAQENVGYTMSDLATGVLWEAACGALLLAPTP
jgi:RHS repeat-associated protein